MAKYPNEAYTPAMEVYKHISSEKEEEAKKIMGEYSGLPEGDAPPFEMAKRFLSLVPKEKQGSLEAIVESAKEFEKRIKQKQAVTGATYGLGNAFSRIFSMPAAQYLTAGVLLAILLA